MCKPICPVSVISGGLLSGTETLEGNGIPVPAPAAASPCATSSVFGGAHPDAWSGVSALVNSFAGRRGKQRILVLLLNATNSFYLPSISSLFLLFFFSTEMVLAHQMKKSTPQYSGIDTFSASQRPPLHLVDPELKNGSAPRSTNTDPVYTTRPGYWKNSLLIQAVVTNLAELGASYPF